MPISDCRFPISGKAGLYVHIPFCKTKCPYCDFYSITELSLIDRWLDALKKEAGLYKGQPVIYDSLYLGGGTPSVLNNNQIVIIMNTLKANFEFTANSEVTIEVNPDDVTADKLDCWYSLGVNRISMGVQSFSDEELLFLKRRHDGSTAEQAIEQIREAGFMNYGIDLMYGLPGQKEDTWKKTLEHALTLEPAHLSCYQLTLEEKTPYGRLKAEGKLQTASESEEKKLFILTSALLKANGFIHYEISNFAKTRKFESHHNLKYWSHLPYLGLGPAAHSFNDGIRWWNHRSVDKYCEVLSRGEKPVEDTETLSEEQLRLERLLLGFRTDRGVAMCDISGDPSFDQTISRLIKDRIVKIRKERVIPTRKGYLIADKLPLMFGEDCN